MHKCDCTAGASPIEDYPQLTSDCVNIEKTKLNDTATSIPKLSLLDYLAVLSSIAFVSICGKDIGENRPVPRFENPVMLFFFVKTLCLSGKRNAILGLFAGVGRRSGLMPPHFIFFFRFFLRSSSGFGLVIPQFSTSSPVSQSA